METRDRIRGRSAVVTGEMAQAQSEANGDDDAGAQRRASAEPFEKGHLRALRAHQMRTGPPGAAGNTGDQNRLETSRERSSALKRELESESQNGNPSLMTSDRLCQPKWRQRKR